MKKLAALILAAGLLSLAGCGTTHHATKQWEYKVTRPPSPGPGPGMVTSENRQKFLDELGKDGWILVAVDDQTGLFYLKRPKK
jgi:hypothetical protein